MVARVRSAGSSMKLEWNDGKALQNARKHRVTFEEAITVFGDPLSITIPDPEHSEDEERFVDIGSSDNGRVRIHRASRANPHHQWTQGDGHGTEAL